MVRCWLHSLCWLGAVSRAWQFLLLRESCAPRAIMPVERVSEWMYTCRTKRVHTLRCLCTSDRNACYLLVAIVMPARPHDYHVVFACAIRRAHRQSMNGKMFMLPIFCYKFDLLENCWLKCGQSARARTSVWLTCGAENRCLLCSQFVLNFHCHECEHTLDDASHSWFSMTNFLLDENKILKSQDELSWTGTTITQQVGRHVRPLFSSFFISCNSSFQIITGDFIYCSFRSAV